MAVALYARVSTTKQAEKDLSIADQLRQMRNWCKKRGYAATAALVRLMGHGSKQMVYQKKTPTLPPKPF